jgi:hypothetical protein
MLNTVTVEGGNRSEFSLVEWRVCPNTRHGFKRELREDETFESEFIGSTVEDCQNWMLETQSQVNFIEQDFIAIADARSATDNTLLVQFYGRELDPEEPVEFEGFGVLPREPNTWVEWRIHPQGAGKMVASLFFGALEMTYPAYLGRREELTDANGIFNVDEAERIVRGERPLEA